MLQVRELSLGNTVGAMYDLAGRYSGDVAPMGWSTLSDVFDGVAALPFIPDELAPECAGSLECVKRPGFTLALGGDCDDKATLALAALSLIGYPARIVTVEFSPGQGDTHTYLEVQVRGSWYPFDATGELGIWEERPYNRKTIWSPP